MLFQVPQFIETEDKIVGPFTIRQFLYIAAGAGVSFMLYFTVQTWLWFILSILIIGGVVALALVKVNGLPLPRVLISAIGFAWQPQTYVWQPEHPELPKTRETLRRFVGPAFSLERIVAGIALSRAWQMVQTGSAAGEEQKPKRLSRVKERYEVFRRITGERRVARRVDYR